MITFSNSESRDLVDTMTQALSYLKDSNILRHSSDEIEKETELVYRPKY